MKKIFVLMIAAVMISSCGNHAQKGTETVTDEIDSTEVVAIDSLSVSEVDTTSIEAPVAE